MIDLAEARALAAVARADTSDGLTAREQLAGVVEALAAEIEKLTPPAATEDGRQDPPRVEWGVQLATRDGSFDVSRSGEWLARERMRYGLPTMLALVRRTVTYGPWVEVPADTEARGE